MMKSRRILLWSLTTIIILTGAVFGVWRILCAATYEGEPCRIYIPSGATAAAVRDTLTANLGAYGAKVARLWELQDGDAARSRGSYVAEPGMQALTLSRAIVRGSETPIRFTFNNMRTFGQLAARAGSRFEADSAAFAAAADSVFGTAGYTPAQYAAAVLPDTYEFYWTADPALVLQTMMNYRDDFWTESRRAAADSLGLTPVDVAIIASIVEEETNKADERGAVARLYINRLQREMPLQADPTVKFALGDFGLRRITGSHLSVDSPYNTYRNEGLPPGPIRIAEASTLDAVLSAPVHNYLYMCARPDFSGYHDFAADYNRHRINAARYHRALAARGL